MSPGLRLCVAPVSDCRFAFRRDLLAGSPRHRDATGLRLDRGLAVNPGTIAAQMESGIVFGLTAALFGEITLERGRVKQTNFDNYPMLGLGQMPVIEVAIIQSGDKIGGIGEPGAPPIAPALVNALFAATGKRIRSLPIIKAGITIAG